MARAQEYIASGHGVVVDIDLEKFFDRVNHDILMGLVAKRVTDKRILKLIRGFLTAGVLADGLVSPTEEGTPQGGPLSPLLSNLMLDELDKELEKRGHRFVRYADDCNIYVRSQRAGERVMASIEQFLDQAPQAQGQQGEERGRQAERPQVPGLQLHERDDSRSGASRRRRIARFKSRVRELTRRTRGQSLAQIVKELSRYLIGWRGYFGFCETPSVLRDLDQWTQAAAARHRLEAVEARAHPLCGAATPRRRPGPGGANRRQPTRPWRLSNSPALTIALPNAFLASLGLASLAPNRPLNPPNRRIRTRTYGGVGGAEPRGSPLSRFQAGLWNYLRCTAISHGRHP